jgi:hypothetical protein
VCSPAIEAFGADKSVGGGAQGSLAKSLIFTRRNALAELERGHLPRSDTSEAVRGGCYLLGIDRYTSFIDSFMRNVNE